LQVDVFDGAPAATPVVEMAIEIGGALDRDAIVGTQRLAVEGEPGPQVADVRAPIIGSAAIMEPLRDHVGGPIHRAPHN